MSSDGSRAQLGESGSSDASGSHGLRRLGPDLWVADLPLRVGPIQIGTRMTALRLPGASLWLHSPIPIDARLRAALDALGRVRWIVAPNKMHHFYVADAAAAYPQAEIWVAPGLPQKKKDLPPHRVLGTSAPEPWQPDVEAVPIEGMPMLNEIAFFHRPSRTLLLTDLAFNVQRAEGFFSRLFWRANAGLGRFGPTRTVRLLMRDRAAVRRSLDRILDWDFDRVTVTHGDVFERGGRAALESAYAFL